MAILRGTARLLLEEHRLRPFSGSVLELARMLVYFTPEELAGWARLHGVVLAPVPSPGLSHDPRLAAQGCMDDRTFFTALGFREIVTCDISDYERPDHLVDLNGPLPEALRGRFDVVFDGGTLQHIFHLPNVLASIHQALKPGGRAVFGMAPSHNHVDHGFYMFSPTFFWDFYEANGYRIETAYVFEFTHFWFGGRLRTPPWKVYAYRPGCLDHLCYGGFGREQVGIFFVATKLPQATGDIVPQQGYYVRLWPQAAKLLGREVAALPRLERWVVTASAMHPLLLRAAVAAKGLRVRLRRWLSPRRPPVVARY